MTLTSLSIRLAIVLAPALLEGQPLEEGPALPPPAARAVNYIEDVHPLLSRSCSPCHGGGNEKGGFSIGSRERLLEGGKSGPAAAPGKSAESLLIELVSTADRKRGMPRQGPRLSPEEIGVLRAWIDQGLRWDSAPPGRSYQRRTRETDLKPRRPEVPRPSAGASEDPPESPVDLFLRAYFEKNGVRPGEPVEDRLFIRRAYLDTLGLLPSPEEVEEFLRDSRLQKRTLLVRRLLSDRRAYAEHWLTFWNDLLRNDYRGTGYIDGGRKQITAWLYRALASNLPYDQMVRELVSPGEESSGFIKGIVWRGAVSASQSSSMQAAQSTSQVFLGINLKCASCHDSFVSDWKLAEAYGLASAFAEGPLEVVRCDVPTGDRAAPRFLYPELGSIESGDPLPRRRERLAEILTSRENGRLARTIANRLWARLLGRGLVEPLDEMDSKSWNPDLLDWLASDLADHGYDIKRTLEVILTSRAYQLPAVPSAEKEEAEFIFRGPAVRRRSAEEFLDALASLTGIGQTFPEAPVDFTCLAAEGGSADGARGKGTAPAAAGSASWIWSREGARDAADAGTVYLRRSFQLRELPYGAAAVCASDDSFRLLVNGKEAASGQDFKSPVLLNLLTYLAEGENAIALEAKNVSPGSPAGLFFWGRIRSASGDISLASDGSWTWSREASPGWEKPGFSAAGWAPAAVLGGAGSPPWSLGSKLEALVGVAADAGRYRASLASADPLMAAMGRPNREQVVSRRPSTATTLEALEMTNGATLARILERGAARLASGLDDSRALAARLFLSAWGRPPHPGELDAAAEVLGSPAGRGGLEDLLWSIVLSPEFQLVD